jgi:hypothetical protein
MVMSRRTDLGLARQRPATTLLDYRTLLPHTRVRNGRHLKHPPGPACVVCGSVAVAEVEGNYLCAVHAIEAMDTRDGVASEETTTARM